MKTDTIKIGKIDSFICLLLPLIAFFFPGPLAFAGELKVITEPVPTVEESAYNRLIQVDSVDEDLGNGHFLFNPFSFTSDRAGNIYVYDNLQARIYKFDRRMELVQTIGGNGQGPGEFSGTGLRRPVYLSAGPDGKLYAADLSAGKVILFNAAGKYIKDIPTKRLGMLKKPVIRENGDLLFYSMYKERAGSKGLALKTAENSCFFRFGPIEGFLEFLFQKPRYLENPAKYQRELVMTAMGMFELDVTIGGKILFYLPASSTLYLLEKGKVTRKMNLWPGKALAIHKKNLARVIKRSKEGYRTMFFQLFPDGDDGNIFYCQLGQTMHNRERVNALYRFNLKGELLKVLYIPYPEGDSFAVFHLKANNRFLAVKDEKIILYKEN